MDLSDFQRRLLGFPQQAFTGLMTSENDAPERQDLVNARWNSIGQAGLALLGASGRMSDAQRAAMLAQGLGKVSDPQQAAMNMSQQRLMLSAAQAKMADVQRQDALRQKLADPAFLQGLGITPQMAEALGPDGVAELLQKRAGMNPLDDELKRAQIRAQEAAVAASMRKDDPKWGQIGTNADGQPAYGYIPSWDGTGAPPSPTGMPAQPSSGPAENIPPGVNQAEFRKQRAAEEAKRLAAEQTQRADAGKIIPDILRARSAYEAGRGYIGPVQSSPYYRSTQSMMPFGMSHGEDVRADIENKLAAYQNPMILQSLPPGAASDKDIEQARKGKASIFDRSPAAGLASIDQDLSATLRRMGYIVPPAHISELLRDIRSNNADGIRQFVEAHQGGDAVVQMLSEAMQ